MLLSGNVVTLRCNWEISFMNTPFFNTGNIPLFRIPRASMEADKSTGKVEMVVDDKGIYFKPAALSNSNPVDIPEPAEESIPDNDNLPEGSS